MRAALGLPSSLATRAPRALLAAVAILALEPVSARAQQAESEVACNEAAEPVAIAYGQHTPPPPATGFCEIGQVTDPDQFEFEASAGDRVRIIGRTGAAGLDLRFELFDALPGRVKIEDVSCDGSSGFSARLCTVVIEREIAETGTHLLLVSDLLVDETGAYVLQLERIPPPPYDDPTLPSLAYNLPLADSVGPVPTDVDFLTFEAEAGTRIRLSLSSRTPGLDPRLEIRDPSGTVVFDDSCDGSSGFSAGICTFQTEPPVASSGTYLVALSDLESDETGEYEISLTCIGPSGACPIVEPLPLAYGEGADNAILQVTDPDQFAFSATAGDQVRIIGRTRTPGLDLRIELFDPTAAKVEIDPDFCDGSSGFSAAFCTYVIEREIEATGEHVLLVSDAGVDETGQYTLQLERIPPSSPPPGLAYNFTRVDSLEPETDVDFLEFEGVAGTQVRVALSSRTPGLDPRLEIRDPSGVLLFDDFCDGSSGFSARLCPVTGDPFPVDLVLTVSGRYLLTLSDENSDESGSYEISLACISLGGVCPAFDPFDTYPQQIDGEGRVIDGETVFAVTDDATTTGGVVVSARGVLAQAVGIGRDGEKFWTLSAIAGTGDDSGAPVLLGDLPGVRDDTQVGAGPFANLFATPQDLCVPVSPGGRCTLSSSLAFFVRQIPSANGFSGARFAAESDCPPNVRLQVEDESGARDACAEKVVTDTFEPLEYDLAQCALEIDLTRVTRFGFEFYAGCTSAQTIPESTFAVDDVTLEVPEPGGIASMVAALLYVAGLARRRVATSRRRSVRRLARRSG